MWPAATDLVSPWQGGPTQSGVVGSRPRAAPETSTVRRSPGRFTAGVAGMVAPSPAVACLTGNRGYPRDPHLLSARPLLCPALQVGFLSAGRGGFDAQHEGSRITWPGSCGGAVMASDAQDPVCGQCGSTITGDAGFCGSCGAALTAEPMGTKPESPGWYPMADGSARFWNGTMWTTRSNVLNLHQDSPSTEPQDDPPQLAAAIEPVAGQPSSASPALPAGAGSSRRRLWWAVGAVLAILVVGLAAFGLGSATRPDAAEPVAQSAAPIAPPPTATPSPSVTAVPTPTVEQATALLDGMYAALTARDPATRDTFIVADVKPKLTTDVVDSVNATNAQVSEVVIAREAPNGPGTAEAQATVTFTQADGDTQIERNWYLLTSTAQGIVITDTGQVEMIQRMPADPTPQPATGDPICSEQCTTSGCVQYQYMNCGGSGTNSGSNQATSGTCHFAEGAGAIVPCSDPRCEPGAIFPGSGSMCVPVTAAEAARIQAEIDDLGNWG